MGLAIVTDLNALQTIQQPQIRVQQQATNQQSAHSMELRQVLVSTTGWDDEGSRVLCSQISKSTY